MLLHTFCTLNRLRQPSLKQHTFLKIFFILILERNHGLKFRGIRLELIGQFFKFCCILFYLNFAIFYQRPKSFTYVVKMWRSEMFKIYKYWRSWFWFFINTNILINRLLYNTLKFTLPFKHKFVFFLFTTADRTTEEQFIKKVIYVLK